MGVDDRSERQVKAQEASKIEELTAALTELESHSSELSLEIVNLRSDLQEKQILIDMNTEKLKLLETELVSKNAQLVEMENNIGKVHSEVPNTTTDMRSKVVHEDGVSGHKSPRVMAGDKPSTLGGLSDSHSHSPDLIALVQTLGTSSGSDSVEGILGSGVNDEEGPPYGPGSGWRSEGGSGLSSGKSPASKPGSSSSGGSGGGGGDSFTDIATLLEGGESGDNGRSRVGGVGGRLSSKMLAEAGKNTNKLLLHQQVIYKQLIYVIFMYLVIFDTHVCFDTLNKYSLTKSIYFCLIISFICICIFLPLT